jgi:hypothetical protein
MTLLGEQDRIVAACNTGPLLSAFQCDGVYWLKCYLSRVYVAPAQPAEFAKHGASHEFRTLLDEGFAVIAAGLSEEESTRAFLLAKQIAEQPTSGDPLPAGHLPEAEMLVIAARPELECKVVLLDEKAARNVAAGSGLRVTGFPGILARAGQDAMLTSADIRRMLKQCQRQGTQYSKEVIARSLKAMQVAVGQTKIGMAAVTR